MTAQQGWAEAADDVRRLGHAVVDIVAELLQELPDGPVFRPFPAEDARRLRAEPVPTGGSQAEEVLAEFVERIAPYPFGNGHPRFFGWVNSPPHPLGVLAEALAAAMNPSVAGGNHAAVHLEHQVVRWFTELAGLPAGSGGLLVSGASAATLTAFAVARDRAARRAGLDVRADGLQGHGRRFVLYLGEESHGCARKAAEVLGIGSANVRTVGSDARHRMRPELLHRAVQRDLDSGELPVVVMASAGTVNGGVIDPLADIADVCADLGVWCHVDGAYGAPALMFVERYAPVRAALGRVDSVGVDAHKWLYAPVDAGLLLLRDLQGARDAFSLVPAYLRTDEDPHGVGGPVWFSEYGIEQTRPFRALKVWLQLKQLGTDGYRRLITKDLELAERLAAGVQAADDLELLAHGLSVVCFRCRPASLAGDEARLDALNRTVLSALQLGGRSFVSGTIVDGVFALRACVVNPASSAADVDAVLADVRARAGAVLDHGNFA